MVCLPPALCCRRATMGAEASMAKRTTGGMWGLGVGLMALFLTRPAAQAQGMMPDATTMQAALRAATPPPHAIWLDSLDLSKITQGFGRPNAGRSVDGNPLTL